MAVQTPEEAFRLIYRAENERFSPKDNIIVLTFDDNYLDQSINLILSIAHYHPPGDVLFVHLPAPEAGKSAEAAGFGAGCADSVL